MFKSLIVGGVATSVLFLDAVKSHTYKICAGVVDQTVTFYAGSWHPYTTTLYGGVILSNGPSGNGRYNFESSLMDDNQYPAGVDLTNFACTACGTTATVYDWQKVEISGLECDSTYDVTTTTDTVVEWPACDFPSITIPSCGCDNRLDSTCKANGDPHFKTWDGTIHHYQGIGYYDYIIPCDTETSFVPVTITAKQEYCSVRSTVTCITQVIVTLTDGTVIVYPTYGGTPTDLAGTSDMTGTYVESFGTYTVEATKFEITFYDPSDDDLPITIKMKYYGHSFWAWTSSDCLASELCGICGNIDGDSSNDFETRDGNILDNTGSNIWRITTGPTYEFGDSWCNEDYTNDPDCQTTEINIPTDECFDAALDLCEEFFNQYCFIDCLNFDYDQWLFDCRYDACSICDDDDIQNYVFEDAVNNGCFDLGLQACQFGCVDSDTEDLPTLEPVDVDCSVCVDQCGTLTSQFGCADNECLDTCKDCISDIDWDDYAGGQSQTCACHENGCNQCQDGWFKIDYDFGCQSCGGLIGCKQCTDFLGCQECESGYTLVEDETCGENSALNTGNTKFHYCVPNDGSSCTIGIDGNTINNPDTVTPDVTQCATNPCDCTTDSNCNDCQSWGCVTCADGYYKRGWDYYCASCDEAYSGFCVTCSDWNGCTECVSGYRTSWDDTIHANLCVKE